MQEVQGFGTGIVADHDGAGTAIALVTTLFGAFQASDLAHIIQQGLGWVHVSQLDGGSVEKKRNLSHDLSCRGLPAKVCGRAF